MTTLITMTLNTGCHYTVVANKPIILSVVMTNVVAPRLPKSYDNLESDSALITKKLK